MRSRDCARELYFKAACRLIGAGALAASLASTGWPRRIPPQEQIVFDFEKTAQVVEGFGVRHRVGQRIAAAEFRALNITHIRVSKGSDSWYDMRDLHRETGKARIRWVYVKQAPPEELLGEDKRLADVAGFADDWLRTVRELNSQSCRPHFIELVNEPDCSGVSPAAYAKLAALVRAKLDNAGFRDIQIVGPGLEDAEENIFRGYFDFLRGPACAGLRAWAAHAGNDAYEDGSGEVALIERHVGELVSLFRQRSPDKPIWYMEYATGQTRFHGIKYPHPDFESENYSASFTTAYAARVFENSIAILNQGANIPFYRASADCRDSKEQWGYIGPDGEKKPVYYALKTLFGNVPPGSRVVLAPNGMSDKNVYAGAFRHKGPGGDKAIIAVANTAAGKRQALIVIENVPPGFAVLRADALRTGKRGSSRKKRADSAEIRPERVRFEADGGNLNFKVSLPSDSALTVILGGAPR